MCASAFLLLSFSSPVDTFLLCFINFGKKTGKNGEEELQMMIENESMDEWMLKNHINLWSLLLCVRWKKKWSAKNMKRIW